MEAVATAVLDEKERERQEQIKKLQNETCFIGHPFGVGVMNFKFMMGQITGYGYDIHLYLLPLCGGTGRCRTDEGAGIADYHPGCGSRIHLLECRFFHGGPRLRKSKGLSFLYHHRTFLLFFTRDPGARHRRRGPLLLHRPHEQHGRRQLHVLTAR